MAFSESASIGWPIRLVAAGSIAVAGIGIALLLGTRIPWDVSQAEPVATDTTQPLATPSPDPTPQLTAEEEAALRAEAEQEARLRELRADRDPVDKYITFLTPYAEVRVRSYAIACPQPGKSVRLMDLMRSGTRFALANGGVMYTNVDSRGEEVRISQDVRARGGGTGFKLVASINEWGELRLHGISRDSVMFECYR